MIGMRASDLIARAARDVGEDRKPMAARPEPRVRVMLPRPRMRSAPRSNVQTASLKMKCSQKPTSCRGRTAGRMDRTATALSRESRAKQDGEAAQGPAP